MQKVFRPRLLLLAASALSMLSPLTTTAHAQEAEQEASQGGLDEIIVTAERRSSSLQTTPMTVTAIGGEELDRLQITDASRLSEFIPALHVSDHGFGGGGNSVMALRGVGSSNLIGDPTVAFHVDGQYYSIGRSLNGTFFDLERVEVLKGPQGTLYGRNSTAGVVNVISARPEDEFSAALTGTIGNYNLRGLQGMINTPIVDDVLAARLAFNFVQHDGYQEGAVQDIYDANDLAIRGSLLFTPTEDLSIQLTVDTFGVDSNGMGYQALNNPYVTGETDPWTNYFNTPLSNEQESTAYRLAAEWDLGAVTLHALTAYKEDTLDSFVDHDGNDVQVSTAERHFDQTAFQQELRLSSNGDGFLDWQVGAFYYKDEISEQFFVLNDLVPNGSMPPVPPFTFINPAGQIDPGFGLALDPNTRDTESFAVFTDNKLHLSDTVTLTLGARYNQDRSERYRDDGNNPPVAKSAEFDSFTWRAGLDWRPSEDLMLYFNIGTGFKSGGTNEGATVPDFDPEEILAYEFGAKSTLLNGRARFNSAFFYYDYTDLQVSIVANNQSLTSNASDAVVYGVEIESQFLLTDRLTLDLSASYVHSEIGDLVLACPLTAFPACPGIPGFFPDGSATIDVSSNPLPQAPEFSVSAGLEYVVPLSSGDLTGSVHYSYQSEVLTQVYADLDPFTLLRQGATSSVDASLRYDSNNNWFGEAFVNNATDEERLTAGFAIPPSAIFGSYAPPRTYGVRLGYRFN